MAIVFSIIAKSTNAPIDIQTKTLHCSYCVQMTENTRMGFVKITILRVGRCLENSFSFPLVVLYSYLVKFLYL